MCERMDFKIGVHSVREVANSEREVRAVEAFASVHQAKNHSLIIEA